MTDTSAKDRRKYDLVDLIIVGIYNLFIFAGGIGLGYVIWGV